MRYGVIAGFVTAILVVSFTNRPHPDFQVGQKWDSGGGSTMQIVARDGNSLTIDSFGCHVTIDDVCKEKAHVFVKQTTKEWAEMLKAWKFTEVKQ